MSFFSISTIAEFLCLVSAFLFLRKADGKFSLFLPYIGGIFFFEFLGWYINEILGLSNGLVFNIVILFTILFFLYQLSPNNTMWSFFNEKRNLISIFLIVTFWAINLIFGQGVTIFNHYSLLAGSIIMLVLCLSQSNLLLHSNMNERLLRKPEFWVFVSCMFYFSGMIFSLLFHNTLTVFYYKTGWHVSQYLLHGINILHYGCLAIAFYFVMIIRKNISNTITENGRGI